MWASRSFWYGCVTFCNKEMKMSVYAISYDLNKPGQNYDGLYQEIKNFGGYWHYLDSMWLVSTSLSATQMSERMLKHTDYNDQFLIIRVVDDYQGWLPKAAWAWIHQHISEKACA